MRIHRRELLVLSRKAGETWARGDCSALSWALKLVTVCDASEKDLLSTVWVKGKAKIDEEDRSALAARLVVESY